MMPPTELRFVAERNTASMHQETVKSAKMHSSQPNRTIAAIVALFTSFVVVGCTANTSTPHTASAPLVEPSLTGSVYGGRQPISGATLHLYAANTANYASTNTDLLTSIVQTGPTGMFDITGKFSCTAGQQIYLVALGGNPGSGTNSQAGLMAALGDCASLSSATFINMNEITTVGSVFALAPFMASSSALGTSSNNVLGLKQAFVSVNKLVNIATGQPGGPALAAGATVPSAEINTLANILAACVNSVGGVSGDGSTCGKEFAYATPLGGTAPTDTIGLALAIAKNPALGAASLYNYSVPMSPYAPTLPSVPNDFSLAITYTTGGLNAPKSTTIDASGNVWVANSGSNTVTVLAQTGAPISGSPFTLNGLDAPTAVAIDTGGNGWVANGGNATVSVFTAAGASVSGSPYAVGTAPSAIAFDSIGNVYVANSSSNSVSVLNASGTVVKTINGSNSGIALPSAIAVNPK